MSLDREQSLEETAHSVIGAAIEVHRHIGPGQLEAVYHRAMEVELSLRDICYRSEIPTAIDYKGHRVGEGRAAMLISDPPIVIELKAVDRLAPIHDAQLLAYMHHFRSTLGFILNFNYALMKDGIRR